MDTLHFYNDSPVTLASNNVQMRKSESSQCGFHQNEGRVS